MRKQKNYRCQRKSEIQQMYIQWNPDFSNLQWKQKCMRKIGEFQKSAGIKV